MKYLKLFLFFTLFFCLVSEAQAGISYKWTSQIVIEDMPDCDIQDVYNALSPTYGNLLLYPDPVTPTIWYVNRTILVDRSNFTLSPERGVTEIRIDNQLGGKQAYTIHGTPGTSEGIIMDGITYTGWDMLNNTPRFVTWRSLELSKGHINNTVFRNISEVTIYNTFHSELSNITYYNGSEEISIENCNNLTISDLFFRDSVGSLVFENTSWCNISNIFAEHIDKYGVMLVSTSNHNTFRNVTVIDVADYLDYSTGFYGFSTNNCNYTTGYDFYLNGSGWSTLCPGGYFGYYENITIDKSGHNSIDLHNVRDSVFVNCSLYAPYKNEPYPPGKQKGVNNVLMTAGTVGALNTSNITMKDIYCFNAGMSIQNGVNYIYLENITMDGEGPGVLLAVDYFTLKNFTFVPNSGSEMESKITIDYNPSYSERSINNTLIDGIFHWLSASDGTRNRLINVKYNITTYKNNTDYYYADVVVKHATGNPLDGTITFSNQNNTSELFSSTDGLANSKQTFSTTDGRTTLPDYNRSDSPAIADTYQNTDSNTTYNFYHTISVSTSSGDVLLTGINPDSSWYRINPEDSTYTITAIVNDSENLHITGYAPSPEYNTFQNNSIVKCQVWASKPLTNLVWKVDGVTKQTGTSTTYESTVGTAPITVDLIGSTATETISKSWVIDPTQTIDPETEPEGNAPVAGFSVDSTAGFKNTIFTFTDSSSNTPTNFYWDFENDGVIDSWDQNPTTQYKVAGNYTVKLIVSNANGMDTETKTAYIQVSGTQLTKKKWYSPFGDWISLFRTYFFGAWLT